MNTKDQIEFLTDWLNSQNNSLRETIVVLANLLVRTGAEHIETVPEGHPVTSAELMNYVLEDRKEHGETIGNALTLQGLTMLSWLEEE